MRWMVRISVPEGPKNKMTRIDIRFSDQDSQGHVSGLKICEWIAHARVEFIDAMIKKSGVDNLDYTLAHLEVDFLEEARFPGTIDVLSRVGAIGGKSLTTKYSVTRDAHPIAKAKCVNVFFNIRTDQTTKIPQALRLVLDGEGI